MECSEGMENSSDCLKISEASGPLSFLDAENWNSQMVVGLGMFKPPSRHGKANNSRSTSEQGSQPVKAGIKC